MIRNHHFLVLRPGPRWQQAICHSFLFSFFFLYFAYICAAPANLFNSSNQLESDFSFIICSFALLLLFGVTCTHARAHPLTFSFNFHSVFLFHHLFVQSRVFETTTKTSIFHFVWLRPEIYAEQRPTVVFVVVAETKTLRTRHVQLQGALYAVCNDNGIIDVKSTET